MNSKQRTALCAVIGAMSLTVAGALGVGLALGREGAPSHTTNRPTSADGDLGGSGNKTTATTYATQADGSTVINGFNFGNISKKTELNIMDYGADNTGATDITKLMQAIHKTGKKIYYPNGTYRFNGYTLELSGGIRFESMDGVTVRNDISDMNIIRFDNQGNLIGLMHNHLELTDRSLVDRCGSLVSPPLSTKKYETKADLLAYWYNDFGLKSIKESKTGWIGWYFWTWNHHNCDTNPYYKSMLAQSYKTPDPYDPSRHPLLGFYYGDDPVVLDWQSYWLYEYGVQNVVILADDFANWEKTGSSSHWAYQLFNNTPNFKNLNYAITVPTPWNEVPAEELRKKWMDTVDLVYAEYDNYYTIEKNGKKYPVLSLLEEIALYYRFGGSAENVRQFYIDLANKFKENGFEGVALLCRNPISEFETPEQLEFFENLGIVRYQATYTPNYVSSASTSGNMTYSQVVDSFNPPSDPRVIQSIANSIDTQTPHESNWKCPGANPADFNRWLDICLSHLDNNPDMKRIITLYNISEWAEGGPGLQPNVQDGFAWLEAIRDAVIK